jgi:hypothetical protein
LTSRDVLPNAFTTKEVVVADDEVIETDAGVKLGVAAIPSLLVTIKFTVPVNPFAGVMVKVTPLEVPPGATVSAVAVPVHGPNEKSPLVAETISTEAIGPFG